tara:strand:- start:142 stop:1467 length:1326 start_codon:yes stop_codon:yes gene_type:complete
MKVTNLFKGLLLSGAVILSSCSKDSPTPAPTNLDCNGVENGTSLTDDCGDCQQAYIYNMTSHEVTLLDDTAGVVLSDPMDMIIMPDNPMNPYWNAGCAGATYAFSHQGQSTVSYGGQTTRLDMASEMMSALASSSTTEAMLNGMFENSGNYFSDDALNAATKQIKSKTAVGAENALTTSEQAAVVALFPVWFADYATNVAPIVGSTTMAAPGTPGMIENRELNAKGLEYDQIVAKSLIGALCLDQVVNNYLSNTVLDVSDNTDRSNGYTTMEHKWDEAYGYVYGKFGPDNSTGDLDSDGLLGKYLNKAGFEAEKEAVFNAFIAGRQAIIDQDYATRDIQAAIIKSNLSKVVAQKAVDYLTGAANTVGSLNADYFHGLSEGYGFILSLQFTNDGNGNAYFTHSEVNSMLTTLVHPTTGNGLWDLNAAVLTGMANTIQAAAGL